MPNYRVSMDIGGTFTDIVAYDQDAGTYAATKASTTPGNLSAGVIAGLESIVDDLSDIDFLVHGTTQGLNAFLERRGVPVLLLATAGIEDTYHIARGPRLELYNAAVPQACPAGRAQGRHRRRWQAGQSRPGTRAPGRTGSPPRSAPGSGGGLRRRRRCVPVQLQEPRARTAGPAKSCSRNSGKSSQSPFRTKQPRNGANTSARPPPSSRPTRGRSYATTSWTWKRNSLTGEWKPRCTLCSPPAACLPPSPPVSARCRHCFPARSAVPWAMSNWPVSRETATSSVWTWAARPLTFPWWSTASRTSPRRPTLKVCRCS